MRFLASLAAASLGLGVTVFVDPPSAVACTASENCKTFCKSFIGLSDDKTNHEGDRKIIQACKNTKTVGECQEPCKHFYAWYRNCRSPNCNDLRRKCDTMKKGW